MEMIHVKFDELTTMASECNNSGPGLNCLNFQDSSKELNEILSQQDLDNFFGPLYEEYYTTSTFKVSNNSAANTLDDEDTPLPSSIIVKDGDAPQIVTSLEEPIIEESSFLVFEIHSDKQIQEDVAELDGNTIMHSFEIPEFEEAESSSNYHDPSNMHEFYQHLYTDKWTKNHPIEQVIVSLMEPKNHKEAMLDHSWIELMQDELNQFKRLDVWELVPLPEGRHAIKVKWLWKNKTDAENIVIRNKSRLVAKVFSNRFAKLMKDNFEMSMMCEMKLFLGLQFHQSPRGIFINLSQYTMEHLKKHEMEKCDNVTTLMATAKIDADLQDFGFELIAYSDANLVGCLDDYKSIYGGLQFLGDKPDSWSSKKHDCTARSTTEAKYISLSACCAQFIWMRTQLLDYGYRQQDFNEHVERGTIELYFVGTEYQLVDLFTKALPRVWFEYLVHRIGMRCITPTELERLAKLYS
ncbi:hypothetical protein Tco_0271453 [Tanacetum coccineum]